MSGVLPCGAANPGGAAAGVACPLAGGGMNPAGFAGKPPMGMPQMGMPPPMGMPPMGMPPMGMPPMGMPAMGAPPMPGMPPAGCPMAAAGGMPLPAPPMNMPGAPGALPCMRAAANAAPPVAGVAAPVGGMPLAAAAEEANLVQELTGGLDLGQLWRPAPAGPADRPVVPYRPLTGRRFYFLDGPPARPPGGD